MTKPTFDKTRPLSWSAISSFEYDAEQWYRKYVLRQEDAATKEMLFGSYVGGSISTIATFMPHIPRLPIFEYELRANFGKIPMIGFIDSYLPHHQLLEYKTGKKPWTKKRADEHGQIDMYLLMLHLMHSVKPHDVKCTIVWLPTQDNGDFTVSLVSEKIYPFETQRTMRQILDFGMRINKRYKEMEDYCQNHV